MQIFVETVDGVSTKEKESIPPKKQRLTLSNEQIKFGRTLNFFSLELQSSDTVKNVKSLIQTKAHILPDQMKLYFDGKELENHQTLDHYDVENGSVLYLLSCSKYRIPIFIKDPYGKAFTLEVEPSDTIENIITKIRDKESTLPDQIQLFFAERELDKGAVSDYNILEGSVLRLVPRRSENSIQISIKSLAGKSFFLDVEPLDTIASVKAKIQSREGILPDKMRLFLAGKELNRCDTLSDCNIEDGSVLHLVSRWKYTMTIFVKVTTGETLFIDAEPLNFIRKIKIKIKQNAANDVGVSPDEMTLIFAGKKLDDFVTLNDCNITEGSILYLITPLKSTMQIFFRSFSGRTLSVDMSPLHTIKFVKTTLGKHENVSADQLEVLLMGKKLEDVKTLSHYNIEKGSILHVVLQSELIQFFVEDPSGKISTMQANPSDTIANVKLQIQQTQDIFHQMSLFFNDRKLEDSETLNDSYVKAGSHLRLIPSQVEQQSILPSGSSSKNIQVFVLLVDPTRPKLTIEIDPSSKVQNLQEKIRDLTGIAPTIQRIIFGGKQLCYDKSLNEYNFKNGSTCYLALIMQGC